MAFFDQIKDMAKAAAVKSEEFAKNVGKKAEAAMEMQKLSSEMEEKERFIKDNYMQMGMELYKKASAGEELPEYLQDYCKLIDTALLEIDELQNKIDLIKQEQFGASPAKIPCPHCGVEVLASSKFCPECGGVLKQDAAKEQTAKDEQEEAVTDADKSAETTVEAENGSEPDAAAKAENEEAKASHPAEAQPEQVNNTAEAQNIEENAAAEEAKAAEVVEPEVEPEAKADTAAAEEITDAEIIEPKPEPAADKKPEEK